MVQQPHCKFTPGGRGIPVAWDAALSHVRNHEAMPDAVRMFAVGEDGKVFDEATIDRAYLDAAETGCAAAQ